MSDEDLLDGVVGAGTRLLQSGKQRLAALGDVEDDPRWSAPFPLRFDLQVAVLFLGALDAYDVTTSLLHARASQQAFNTLRFQMESLALARWMSEPPDTVERQLRAYKVSCGQLRRWGTFLLKDAGRDREALEGVHRIRQWGRRLRELAAEDGIHHLKEPPSRKALLRDYSQTSGHPTFNMLSELGSHPGAAGNTLFSLRPGERMDYDLEGAFAARAFLSSTAIIYLWQTCEAVSKALDWNEWLTKEAAPIYLEATRLIAETYRRRKAAFPSL